MLNPRYIIIIIIIIIIITSNIYSNTKLDFTLNTALRAEHAKLTLVLYILPVLQIYCH
jgi:hypothetical protein